MIRHLATSRARHAAGDSGGGYDSCAFDGIGFSGETTSTCEFGWEVEGSVSAAAAPALLTDPQDGAHSNGFAQGECFADVLAGMVKSIDPVAVAVKGAEVAVFGMPPLVAAETAIEVSVQLAHAAVNAFKESPACQALDNAREADRLGIAAIQAP